MGCVDLETKQEAHCFNIIKTRDEYAVLDYSIPISFYENDGSIKVQYPFLGFLSNTEFLEFIDSGVIKSFDDYCIKENKREKIDRRRSYVVGKYEIKKDVENDITK